MNTSMFSGVTVAMVTPFTHNQTIDESALRNLVERQIEGGTDVLLACGTTGESVTLDSDEKERVLKIMLEQADRRVPVLSGAGTNDTRDAVRLTREAEKAGANGILSVGPYYNKPTQEGFFQHFRAIAAATDLPVLIYNVPGRTGANISATTTLRLAEIENIIGIKEASGNISQIMAILRERPDGFLVLSGDDAISLPLIALGGDGVISVVANEIPGLFAEMIHAALANHWDRARELHFRLLPLMEINFIESNPIPVKAALAMMGLIREVFRLPLVPISEKSRTQLLPILEELKLLEITAAAYAESLQ